MLFDFGLMLGSGDCGFQHLKRSYYFLSQNTEVLLFPWFPWHDLAVQDCFFGNCPNLPSPFKKYNGPSLSIHVADESNLTGSSTPGLKVIVDDLFFSSIAVIGTIY